jgi:hypothetical protein
MCLLTIVERYLRKRAIPPSRFGRQAAGDPRLVFDLRRGREPGPATVARVQAFIAAEEAGGLSASIVNQGSN